MMLAKMGSTSSLKPDGRSGSTSSLFGEEYKKFVPAGDIVLRTSWAVCVAFLPLGSRDDEEKVDTEDGELEDEVEKDEGLYVWGGLNNTCTIVGLQSPALECRGHTAYVSSIAVHPDGEIVASSSGDKSIKLWGRQGQLLQTLTGHLQAVQAVAWHPFNGKLASGSVDKTVKIWSGGDGMLMTEEKSLTDHSDDVNCVAWSPDGKRLASGGDDGLIALNNPSAQIRIQQITNNVASLCWSPSSSEFIAVGCYDGTVRTFNAETEQQILTLSHSTPMVTAVLWNHHGLWSAGWDMRVNLWNPEGGNKINTLRTGSKVFSMTASDDGNEIGITTQAGKLMVWKLKSVAAEEASFGRRLLTRLGIDRIIDLFRSAEGSNETTTLKVNKSINRGGAPHSPDRHPSQR